MRRICFDVASNFCHDLARSGAYINEPWQARIYWENKTPEFHAATAFDSSAKAYRSFTDHRRLFDLLVKADEIVTYNGRVYDLIVLEKLVGEEQMASIWRKPHHDLIGWHPDGCNWKLTLEKAINDLLPKRAEFWETIRSERLAKIHKTVHDDFFAGHLAETYRDVKFTMALFRLYERSGSTRNTFRDE